MRDKATETFSYISLSHVLLRNKKMTKLFLNKKWKKTEKRN